MQFFKAETMWLADFCSQQIFWLADLTAIVLFP